MQQKVKAQMPNLSCVSAEKGSLIGKLQPNSEIKKRSAGDFKIGSGLSPTAGVDYLYRVDAVQEAHPENKKELITMVNTPSKTNAKRLPKGQRTHTRRLKQAARKEVGTNSPQSSSAQSKRANKKQDQS